MSSEISSIDLWTGILRRLEYCRRPNTRPKMETRMPDISSARPLRPPMKLTELKSGRTRSASLARAVLPASRAKSPKTLAAAVRETVGVMGLKLLKQLVLARGSTAPHAGWDQEIVEGLAAC